MAEKSRKWTKSNIDIKQIRDNNKKNKEFVELNEKYKSLVKDLTDAIKDIGNDFSDINARIDNPTGDPQTTDFKVELAKLDPNISLQEDLQKELAKKDDSVEFIVKKAMILATFKQQQFFNEEIQKFILKPDYHNDVDKLSFSPEVEKSILLNYLTTEPERLIKLFNKLHSNSGKLKISSWNEEQVLEKNEINHMFNYVYKCKHNTDPGIITSVGEFKSDPFHIEMTREKREAYAKKMFNFDRIDDATSFIGKLKKMFNKFSLDNYESLDSQTKKIQHSIAEALNEYSSNKLIDLKFFENISFKEFMREEQAKVNEWTTYVSKKQKFIADVEKMHDIYNSILELDGRIAEHEKEAKETEEASQGVKADKPKNEGDNTAADGKPTKTEKGGSWKDYIFNGIKSWLPGSNSGKENERTDNGGSAASSPEHEATKLILDIEIEDKGSEGWSNYISSFFTSKGKAKEKPTSKDHSAEGKKETKETITKEEVSKSKDDESKEGKVIDREIKSDEPVVLAANNTTQTQPNANSAPIPENKDSGAYQLSIYQSLDIDSREASDIIHKEAQETVAAMLDIAKGMCFERAIFQQKYASACWMTKPQERVDAERKIDCDYFDLKAKITLELCNWIFPFQTAHDELYSKALLNASKLTVKVFQDGSVKFASETDESLAQKVFDSHFPQYKQYDPKTIIENAYNERVITTEGQLRLDTAGGNTKNTVLAIGYTEISKNEDYKQDDRLEDDAVVDHD